MNIKEINNIHINIKTFAKRFKYLYTDKNFKLKHYYLKYKYKKICYPENLDEIFDYSNKIEKIGIHSIFKNIIITKKSLALFYFSKKFLSNYHHHIFSIKLCQKFFITINKKILKGYYKIFNIKLIKKLKELNGLLI